MQALTAVADEWIAFAKQCQGAFQMFVTGMSVIGILLSARSAIDSA